MLFFIIFKGEICPDAPLQFSEKTVIKKGAQWWNRKSLTGVLKNVEKISITALGIPTFFASFHVNTTEQNGN